MGDHRGRSSSSSCDSSSNALALLRWGAPCSHVQFEVFYGEGGVGSNSLEPVVKSGDSFAILHVY